MGGQWSQIVKQEKDRTPQIADYTRCQRAVFIYSSLSMAAISAGTFGILTHRTFKSVNLKSRCLVSGLVGAGCSWYIALVRTKFCHEYWKMLDEQQKEELVNTFKNRRLRPRDD